MSKANRKSNTDKHYSWLMGADMYLAATVLLCDEMLSSYSSPIQSLNSDQRIDKKCGFTSANPDYEMLMPVIFNLKHGIELYLKALIMTADKNSEYPVSHDLLFLLNTLINTLQMNTVDSKILNLLDIDTRAIIEKYYYGLYAFSKYKSNPDIYNEAERYPEYKNSECYQIKDLYNIVNNDLMNLIKKDCIELQKILREEVYKKL